MSVSDFIYNSLGEAGIVAIKSVGELASETTKLVEAKRKAQELVNNRSGIS